MTVANQQRLLLGLPLVGGALAPIILCLWRDPPLINNLVWLAGNSLIFAFSTLPYLILAFLLYWVRPSLGTVIAIFALAMGIYSFWVYFLNYVIRNEPEAGMVFFFLTIYELGVVSIFGLVILTLHRLLTGRWGKA